LSVAPEVEGWAGVPGDILAPITEAAIFLTWTVDPGDEDHVREALSDVTGLKRSVGAGLRCRTSAPEHRRIDP
jgi:hypothetical protein